MKKSILVALFAMGGALFAQEQGQSLAQKLDLVKQKTDKFNAYMNFHSSFDAVKEGENDLQTAFKTRELRLEFKGDINDKLSYRFRHRLYKSNAAVSDGLSYATDYMYINYKVTDKFNLTMGKIAQAWGGWEFALTPFNVYEYSDFLYNVSDVFLMGVNFGYQLTPNHEVNFTLTNNANDTLGNSNNPLAYTFNWNGNMLDGQLQTRWAFIYETLDKDNSSKMVTLGNKLNLDKVHISFDYYRANQDLDRLGYAKVGTNDKDAVYNTFVTKVEYQAAEKWNVFAKYMYETAEIKDVEKERISRGYFAGVEYLPIKSEDLRFYLVYVGRKLDNRGVIAPEKHRVSLGMMYRINMF